jgi:CheY-like chemotaxis protein
LLASALPPNILLEFDLAPDLWPVTVDATQLELAFLNLVINARDAMPRGGRVTLAGRNETQHGGDGGLDGDYVVLTLTDDGHGMSEEVLARALDPFYTTKEHGKGSGMGLPQAHGVARMHGGLLTLKSRPGDGTTVTLYLPRAADGVVQATPAPKPFSRPKGGGMVLLVDDDDDLRMMVRQALKLSGFDVRAAATADEALERIERGESFDAVLTDVVMPGKLNGMDLAERLVAAFPRIGVVVGTAHAERVVRLPGVRVLAKPFDLRELVEALNEAIARASATA